MSGLPEIVAEYDGIKHIDYAVWAAVSLVYPELYPNTLNVLAKQLRIMGDKRLIERIVQIVLENTGNSLIRWQI
jgi:hypothetical protein